MTYRTKPVVIEAVHFDGQNISEVVNFTGSAAEWWWTWYGALRIRALMFVVAPGDWIIKGITGELGLVKPAIFAATYESVDA